nr:hypothetical protein [Streptomyces antibioticus]
MTDQPETPGRRMSRLIRETPPPSSRQQLLDSFRRTWAKPAPKPDTTEETHRG